MSNIKISQLPTITSMSLTDIIPVVSGGTTSQITLGNLKASMGGGTLAITSVSPLSGKVGDTISIIGTNFTYATEVLFGGVTASFTILGDTYIQAVLSPAGASGYVSVVTVSTTALYPGFTYVYGPIISSFSPTNAGPEDSVTIYGTNFVGPTANAVYFGGVAAQSFTVVNNTTINTVVAYDTNSGTVSVVGPNGVGYSTGFTYNTPKKLSLIYTSNNQIIHEEDDLPTMLSWISLYSITAPLTLQFNTSDTFLLTSQIHFGFNNSGYTFSVVPVDAHAPILDVQMLDYTVVQVGMSNFYMSGLTLQNARPCSNPGGSDEGGTIVRINGSLSNIILDSLILNGGFCGIRGTTNISNLVFSNIQVLNVWAGCFRMGNGDWLSNNGGIYAAGNYDFDQRPLNGYDMYNITISNVTATDNTNGGTVSGTQVPGNTSGYNYSGVILLKMFHTINMSNVTLGSNGGDCIAIENSFNVSCSYINIYDTWKNGRGFLISNTDSFTIAQSFCSDRGDGSSRYLAFLQYIRGLKLYFNTFFSINSNCGFIYGNNQMKITEIAGNAFTGNVNNSVGFSLASTATLSSGADSGGLLAYTASLSQDWISDHDNVYSSNGSYVTILSVSNFGPGGLVGLTSSTASNSFSILNNVTQSNQYTPAQYLAAGYGSNNKWAIYPTQFNLTSRTNTDGSTSSSVYIPNGFFGRNSINSPLSGVSYTLDLAGNTRSYPTDMGAYDRDAI